MDPICVGAGRRCYNGDKVSLPSNHGIQVEVDLLAVQESHIFHHDISAMVNLNCLQIISKQNMVCEDLHTTTNYFNRLISTAILLLHKHEF
jgi:hypothetical protein